MSQELRSLRIWGRNHYRDNDWRSCASELCHAWWAQKYKPMLLGRLPGLLQGWSLKFVWNDMYIQDRTFAYQDARLCISGMTAGPFGMSIEGRLKPEHFVRCALTMASHSTPFAAKPLRRRGLPKPFL